MCKQVVVFNNGLQLILAAGVCSGGCVVCAYMCACTCMCRSEYQQLDWVSVPVPAAGETGI